MKPVAAFLGLSVQFLAVSAWAQDPNLSSGGLAPPDAIQSENQPTDQDKTEADLKKALEEFGSAFGGGKTDAAARDGKK